MGMSGESEPSEGCCKDKSPGGGVLLNDEQLLREPRPLPRLGVVISAHRAAHCVCTEVQKRQQRWFVTRGLPFSDCHAAPSSYTIWITGTYICVLESGDGAFENADFGS